MGVGVRLRALREQRAISLDALAQRTRIAPRVLRAIERDDFGSVPEGIFVRGYLRAYAREIELDPEEIVAQYRAEHEPATQPAPSRSSVASDTTRTYLTRQAYTLMAVAVGASVLAALFWPEGSTTLTTAGPSAGQTAHSASPPASFPAERGMSSPADARTTERPEQRAAQPAAAALDVTLVATRVVWVAGEADGKRMLYRQLQPGEQVSIRARNEARLRVGDAGALTISINGAAPLGAGESGEVRNLQVTSAGITPLPE
jgi:cytoskeletal protein RodZ